MISPGISFPGGFCNPLNGQFRIVLPVVISDLDTDMVTRSGLNRNGLQGQPAGSIRRKRVELIRSEMTPYADRLLNLVGSKRAFEVPLLSEPFRPGRNIMTPFRMKSRCMKLVAKDGSAASFDTLVYGAANRGGLALMFLNFEPEMDKIKTATHTRDTGEVWNDDNVEVFLYTADASRGIQYILTAAGNIHDAKLAAGNPPDTAWNGRAETFVWKGPDRRFAQIFIPWSDLGVTLAEASKLKLNLYRTRCTKVSGGEFAAYSPTMTHQHNRPEFFAPLVIGKRALATDAGQKR